MILRVKNWKILTCLRRQHASAVGIWFVIGWQIEYRDVEVEPMINLTHRLKGARENVIRRLELYSVIRDEPKDPTLPSRYNTGLWVTRLRAGTLSSHFGDLLIELHAV